MSQPPFPAPGPDGDEPPRPDAGARDGADPAGTAADITTQASADRAGTAADNTTQASAAQVTRSDSVHVLPRRGQCE